MPEIEKIAHGWIILTNEEEYSLMINLILADKQFWQIFILDEYEHGLVVFENELQAQIMLRMLEGILNHRQNKYLAERLMQECLENFQLPPE